MAQDSIIEHKYSFRDLVIWQRSMTLTTKIYRITEKFPEIERFGLVSQLRRAIVSVPSNIAEGRARGSTKEFHHFLSIANGSLSEVETQLLISVNLGFLIEDEGFQQMIMEINEISKQINALRKKLMQ